MAWFRREKSQFYRMVAASRFFYRSFLVRRATQCLRHVEQGSLRNLEDFRRRDRHCVPNRHMGCAVQDHCDEV